MRSVCGVGRILVLVSLLAGCTAGAPGFGEIDRYRVFTPVYSDNRVFHVGVAKAGGTVAPLVLQGAPLDKADVSTAIKHGEPLSVIVNSVEMPQTFTAVGEAKNLDVAVIVDVASAPDGTSASYVVWFQRGVQPGQSLNFSNLLVYFEPRWDERIAPLFRIRVMDVRDEKNAETLAALDQVQKYAGAIAGMISSPVASPLVSIATRAAGLVMTGQKNQMLLDYTVQFYSAQAATQTGGAGLGMLRRGAFITIGSPPGSSRDFWAQTFDFEQRSRIVRAGKTPVVAPMARMTVGTFESVVPKIVIERSNALTEYLTQQSAKVSLEQLEARATALQASIGAFAAGERLRRFGATNRDSVDGVRRMLDQSDLTAEDKFYLLRALTKNLNPPAPFTSAEEVDAFLNSMK